MPFLRYYYKSLFKLVNQTVKGVIMGFNPGKELYQISDGKRVEFDVGGLPIVGSLNIPKNLSANQQVPCLINFPGWQGTRKGKQKLHLAVELVKAGWAVFRLDPPGFGESDGNPKIVTLELYAQTIQKAISALANSPAINMNRIAIHGTSVGGSAAILAAAMDTRVKAMVLWAPRSDYHDTTPGLYTVTGGVNHVIRDSGLAHDFYESAVKFTNPMLIVHGADDSIVNPKQSCMLKQVQPSANLRLIKGANHIFYGYELELITTTVDWLVKESGIS